MLEFSIRPFTESSGARVLSPDLASSPVSVVKASKAVFLVLTALPCVLPFVTQRIPSHKEDIQNIGMELCVHTSEAWNAGTFFVRSPSICLGGRLKTRQMNAQ